MVFVIIFFGAQHATVQFFNVMNATKHMMKKNYDKRNIKRHVENAHGVDLLPQMEEVFNNAIDIDLFPIVDSVVYLESENIEVGMDIDNMSFSTFGGSVDMLLDLDVDDYNPVLNESFSKENVVMEWL